MRHFSSLATTKALPTVGTPSLAITKALLPIGVSTGAASRPLVLRAGSTTRLATADLAASVGAVDLAVVTAAANGDLLMTARAMEQSVALVEHGTRAATAFWTRAP